MEYKEIKTQILYPVTVALILGGLTILGNMYVTQKVILHLVEEMREDLDNLYSLTDDHVRDSH